MTPCPSPWSSTNAINSLYATARVMPVRGLTISGGVGMTTTISSAAIRCSAPRGAYTPDGGTPVLRATYDQGFKAPSLYQMFSDYYGFRAASGKGQGLGSGRLAQSVPQGDHAGGGLVRAQQHLITFAYCPYSGTQPAICYVPGTTSTRFGYYANVGAARTRGLELTGALRTGALLLTAITAS
jgi:vitamin B12 transporter